MFSKFLIVIYAAVLANRQYFMRAYCKHGTIGFIYLIKRKLLVNLLKDNLFI